MHEMSLIASVLEIADRQMEGIAVKRVCKIKMQVGELANALEDALRFAFEAYSQDTIYAGAALEIEVIPATWRCLSCKHEFTNDIGIIICPKCQGINTELIRGKELMLESLEVE